MFQWYRNYMNAKRLFLNPEEAARVKRKYALLYAFAAWNVFGFYIVSLYKEKVPRIFDSVDHAKVLGIKNATVVKFSGLSKVDEYDIELSDKELQKFIDTVGSKEEMKKYEEERLAQQESQISNT